MQYFYQLITNPRVNELLKNKTFSSISATCVGFLAILVERIVAALCMYQDSPTGDKDAKEGERND
jgi:hypothetical protein